MAWIKIPAEHHPIFRSVLPSDPRIVTIQMFGGLAALTGGNMFAGLFAKSVFVRLSEVDQRVALTLDGAAPFDPMGTGRAMADSIHLPDWLMDEPDLLRDWVARAFAHALTLPPKKPRPRKNAAEARAPKRSPSARSTPRTKAKAMPKSKIKDDTKGATKRKAKGATANKTNARNKAKAAPRTIASR